MARTKVARLKVQEAQHRRVKLVDARLSSDSAEMANRVDLRTDALTTDTVLVTPSMAAAWIEKNYHGQRTLRWVDVLRYANIMKDGRWRLTHQGIGFDKSGTLIDGQHRLWAVVEADVNVLMRVTFGVPHDAFGALDQNRIRTVSELAEAEWITPRVTQIGKAMARGPVQSLDSSTINDRDPDELIAFIERHKVVIEQSLKLLPGDNYTKGRKYVTTICLAVLARANYSVSTQQLRSFVDVLTTGITGNKEDRAAILLREMVVGTRTDKGTRSEKYQKTQRAVRAYVDRDPIKRLVGTTDDLFPLPGVGPQRMRPTGETVRTKLTKRRQKSVG